MLTVRLDADQDAALTKLARETGRPKSYYVREALAQFLEDRADYLTAVAALERREETISLDALNSQLGL